MTFGGWGTDGTVVEPQGGNVEDCAVLWPAYSGRWADVGCHNLFNAVCETVGYPTW